MACIGHAWSDPGAILSCQKINHYTMAALGAPLSPGYSIAADPRFVPLGAPVYLATTLPLSAASIITPMMLFPFTGIPSFTNSTCDWNRLATRTS